MKSLILYDKIKKIVLCCGLDIYDCRDKIEKLCLKANSERNNAKKDRYIVCEIDGNCWDYPRDELVHLCECYCKQMRSEKNDSRNCRNNKNLQ